ncbi:MAG: helix-turn-helix transcriptional regulator [Thermoleophilaceae bacterium]|nr:helix-turn-helix transcriptional regulator [Thermoleophilaceae bacterium]
MASAYKELLPQVFESWRQVFADSLEICLESQRRHLFNREMTDTADFEFGFDPDAPREPSDSAHFEIEMARFEGNPPGQTMRWIRAWSGYTLEAAAEKMGVSPGKLLDYENGTVKPQWNTVFKLAEALGVTGRKCAACGGEKPIDPDALIF